MAKTATAKTGQPTDAKPTSPSNPPAATTEYPKQIRARLIGSSRWQLTAKLNDYDPGRPESVLAAFESIGLKGPFGVFYRVEYLSTEEISAHYKQVANGTIPPGTLHPAPKYFKVDEDAQHWDGIRANVHLGEMAYGGVSEFPGSFGSQCGRVEQWLALSRLAQSCLRVLKSPWPGFQLGFLMRQREPDRDRDLCLAVTDGPPILAVGEKRDFEPKITHEPETRVLSVAGQAVLFWAEATLRLRAMFNEVDVQARAQMKATSSLFERRKPFLDWTGEDDALLSEVRRELIAFAPLWRKKAGEPARDGQILALPASQLSTPALTPDHERMLLFLAKPENMYRSLKVDQTVGKDTTHSRHKAGQLLRDLEGDRLIERRRGERRGFSIISTGLALAHAIKERPAPGANAAQPRS